MSDTPEEPIVTTEPAPEVEESNGLGDVVENVLVAMGGNTIAAMIERVTKKPCNCGARKQRLNALGDQAAQAATSASDYIRARVRELSQSKK